MPKSVVPVSRHRRLALAAGAALALSGFFAASAPNLAANTSTPGGAGAPGPQGRLGVVRRLGLSDDQKQQIRGVLKSHSAEIEAQLQATRTGGKALRQAIAAQPLDEGLIRQQALALGEVRADGAVLRARIHSEIWPILTPEQQETAKKLRSMKGRRNERRMDALERWLQNG